MSGSSPTILWLRRDLRLSDHPALLAAMARGGPVIPLFIRDESVDGLGAAPKWRLGLSLETLARALEERGSRLILRSGGALEVLRAMIAETGADAVHWSRLYDPDAIQRDKRVKSALTEDGIEAKSQTGHLLFEPWTVKTGTGGFYRIFTPMWRAVKDRAVPALEAAPSDLAAPKLWPESERLADWALGHAMNRASEVCRPYQNVGEAAAQDRLGWFIESAISAYKTNRDLPAGDGCSGLSENLALGEISPRQCWHASQRALHEGANCAEAWLRQLVWREFAYHLLYHKPHILTRCWREEWESFPWSSEEEHPHVLAWKQGRTGIAFVDAAMREIYVTGKMHNRARMIVASYLTKHLLMDWRIGMRWFEECLTDWDPANNTMGWQWVAGCGPDASPYFRIFNPDTQAEKFDPDGIYRRRWVAEGSVAPSETALSFFDAAPRSWRLSPDDARPVPIVGLAEGRQRALLAYGAR